MFDTGIQNLPVILGEFDFGKAAFVINRHGRAIRYGLADVVNINVIAKDRFGVAVGCFDGRAGKADEGRFGQGVAHVAGKTVNEIVLAAVGLVGDDDDVAAFAQQGIGVSLQVREEFLNGGKDDPARGHRQEFFEFGAVGRLHGRLAQQLPAVAKGLVKLLVEVVAVGDDDNGGVVHLFRQHQFAGVKDHRKALAAALGVPDHAGALVAARLRDDAGQLVDFRGFGHHERFFRPARRPDGGLYRPVDGVILVVGGDLLVGRLSGLFKDDKVADDVQQGSLGEQSPNQRFEFGLAA